MGEALYYYMMDFLNEIDTILKLCNSGRRAQIKINADVYWNKDWYIEGVEDVFVEFMKILCVKLINIQKDCFDI